MLGLHLRTTGDDRWNEPFDIVRDGENTFTWFHSAIAEHLTAQWTERARRLPLREHEGLAVLPRRRGPRPAAARPAARHRPPRGVRRPGGTTRAAPKYLHLDGDELPEMVTLYYDPILDVHHEVPVVFGMIPAIYLAPQVPDEARRLFEAGMHADRVVGAERADRAARSAAVGDSTCGWRKEWGLDDIADALDADGRRALRADVGRDERRVHVGLRARRAAPARSVQRDDGGRAGRDRGLVVAARQRRARRPLHRTDRRRRRLPDRRAPRSVVGRGTSRRCS